MSLSPAQFEGWKPSGSIYVLTTPEGANLPATAAVDGFPLLVRLHKDFFDFSQVRANGADLRFTSQSGGPLAYQIEEWDPINGLASVWVRVPQIKGNARQEIKLYWGNPDALNESNGRAVFNESNGYLSVWHMNDVVQDDVGTLASKDTGTTPMVGMIGKARHFPGQKGVFCGEQIPNYPAGANSHSTEAWFRAERPNATIWAGVMKVADVAARFECNSVVRRTFILIVTSLTSAVTAAFHSANGFTSYIPTTGSRARSTSTVSSTVPPNRS